MSYPPTPEQQVAIDLARQGKTMKLLAFAGAGKTSTLVFVANALKDLGKSGVYLAFNRAIANEAQRKMPKNVKAKTFHSMALASAPDFIRRRLEDDFAIWDFIEMFGVEDILMNEIHDSIGVVQGKVQNVKKKGRGIITPAKQKNIVDTSLLAFYKDETEEPKLYHVEGAIEELMSLSPDDTKVLAKELYPIAVDMWRDFINPNGKIGLAGRHDVYLKLWALSKPQIDTDFILFDEAQDADPIMSSILTSQKAQVIYVGDPYQQIYSFRGALNVMQNLDAPQAELTQSFRFGHELAIYCQPILNALGCRSRILGLQTKETQVIDGGPPSYTHLDAILTRSNAEAVNLVMDVVNRQKNGYDTPTVLPQNISFKETKQMMYALAGLRKDGKSDHPKLKGFENFEQVLEYAQACPMDSEVSGYVRMFQNIGFINVLEAINSVEQINPKTHKGPIITTMHRSKGLEWDNVMLADDVLAAFVDESGDMKEDLSAEELRLLYVGITRAQKKLYLNNMGDFLKELAVHTGEAPLCPRPRTA
ncbi:3'-5' exonuclease [Moraxella sp. ZJ142]|uniref:3'-5' exonuclease n=1 Tax=Moraxella marmotae TaxID=3344520 RepID=UPI0035D3EDF4